MDLAAYDALKFDLAGVLRGLRHHYARTRTAEPEALRDFFARLAEDRFNLAVVGRFSRGKTSLMNAILGTDLLPVGVLPITSVITMVSYGSEPKAVLHYRGTSLFMDVPISELAQHITERGNPGNRRGIRAVEVQVPAEFLRRGFTFVDTPGLGSSIRENTRTTEAFLPEADALILVSSHDSPLSEEEAAIVTEARVAGRALFVVLNKQDLVDPPSRAAAVEHVAALLRQAGTDGTASVFSVSARDGLAAKRAGDPARLAESGLPALEQALVAFLLHERQAHFLAAMCARIAPLLESPGAPAALASALAEIRARITAAGAPPAPMAEPAATLAPLLPGCEVCRVVAETVFDTIAREQAELSANRAAQADLAQRGGFCRFHAAQFRKIAATREAATVFAPVLRAQGTALRRLDPADPGAAACVAALPADGTSCPICDVARQAEARAVAGLAALVAQQGAAVVHGRSALCLPHLAPLLAAVPDAAARGVLLTRQAALMERLAEDAQRFALQQDAVRRDRSSREDLAAADRAARVLLELPAAQYDRATPGKSRPILGENA
ncbi:MAG: dynamin family protein [Rhodospirillales bacterium]|nr:dynamin family protein [Rhodospirillales bacterium]